MTRLFALAALTTTLLACSPADSFNSFGVDIDDGYYQDTNVTGRMQGTMPEVGTFENEDGYGNAWNSDDWLDMQLHVKGDFGWAMVGVSAMLDDNGDIVDGSDSVIGCTGPQDGWADFDEQATDSVVTIDIIEIDGEPVQEIEITAEFDQAGTVVAVAHVPVGE